LLFIAKSYLHAPAGLIMALMKKCESNWVCFA
jgi:hypothetical protein